MKNILFRLTKAGLFIFKKGAYFLLIIAIWIVVKVGAKIIGRTIEKTATEVVNKPSELKLVMTKIEAVSLLVPEGYNFKQEEAKGELGQGVLKRQDAYVLQKGDQNMYITYMNMEFINKDMELTNQDCLRSVTAVAQKVGSNLGLKETQPKTTIGKISTYSSEYVNAKTSYLITAKAFNDFPVMRYIVCITKNEDSLVNNQIFNSIKFN
jgi:hypothetical protein